MILNADKLSKEEFMARVKKDLVEKTKRAKRDIDNYKVMKSVKAWKTHKHKVGSW